MTYPTLTEDDIDRGLLDSEVVVAIYVTSRRCPISRRAKREFKATAALLQHQIAFFEVDADREKALVSRINIKAVPALLVFTSGNELAALLGFYSRDELQALLRDIISNRG